MHHLDEPQLFSLYCLVGGAKKMLTFGYRSSLVCQIRSTKIFDS